MAKDILANPLKQEKELEGKNLGKDKIKGPPLVDEI